MYTLIVENERGEQLTLTSCDVCDVLRVDGLNPPPANINLSETANIDGASFKSSRISSRNIVILLNVKTPIEANRQQLYKFFRSKRWCRLYYTNDSRDVYIDGYVETFENDQFTNLQKPQISIICPKPFFKNRTENTVEFSETSDLFEFPFSIADEGAEMGIIEKVVTRLIDAGEVETGAIISLVAGSDQILNPTIYNRTTQTYFGLDVDMSEGDLITICTIKGEKAVTLLRDGVTTNIIDKMSDGSTWLEFEPGENEISYGADVGASNLKVSLTITQLYEGV